MGKASVRAAGKDLPFTVSNRGRTVEQSVKICNTSPWKTQHLSMKIMCPAFIAGKEATP